MTSMLFSMPYLLKAQATRARRVIYALLGLFVSAMLLASCGGGAGTVGTSTGKTFYTTAPSSIAIAVGSAASYEIGGGTATYKASTSNAGVVSVEVKATTLSIKALANGTAQIVLSDATGAQLSVNVVVGTGTSTVDLFVTAPSALAIAPGMSSSYVIGGGKPAYFVSSSNAAVATVGINNNNFFISGIKPGTAQIIIIDSTGTAVSVNVTVGSSSAAVPLYLTAAGTIDAAIDELNDFMVGGGTGPYVVTSSNKRVATVALTGNAVVVKAMAKGSAQITVFDAVGASVSTTLVVDLVVNAIPLYVAAPTAVTMAPGAKAVYSVGGGNVPYEATSSNVTVAKAEISNNVLTINAVAAGTAQILVFDANGVSVSVALTVGAGGSGTSTLYTTAGTGVVMSKGTSNTYKIGGGKAPYIATSSNTSVVTVPSAVSGVDVTVTSVAVGSSQVTIYDANGNSVNFSVTVSAGDGGVDLFTTAGNSLTLAVGTAGTYVIGGGAAPYSVTSSNAGIVTAKVVDNTSLELTPMAVGSTQVTVYDSSGASVLIGVAVAATTTGPIEVQPNGASGNVGDALKFLLSGGTSPYTVTVNNTNIAKVEAASVTSTGFTADLLNVGSTTLVVKDAAGQVQSISLSVSQINTTLRLSPNNVLLSEDSVSTVDLNVFGGTGPYRAFTSDQTLTGVSVAGSVLSVGLGTNLNRCINPVDSGGVRVPNGTFDVTIMVLDSLGASATSVLTIKDNGRGTGSFANQPLPFTAPCQ